MKLAIQNSWPNLSVSAEREFIARFLIAGRSLGWTVEEVVTSDEIYAFEPDAVLVTHEFTPKLTKFPTIGVIWNPIAFFGDDPDRIRNILSYDGYLVATQHLREYFQNLLTEHGKSAPIAEFDFFPSALRDVEARDSSSDISLFYAGVHWDGDRHDGLFNELNNKIPISIYGAAKKWESVGEDYHGTIPFDGRSVATEIARCGVALSLHTPNHREEGVPSMRLFEAASAGAVIISDRIPFAEREFGDSLLYVDPGKGAAETAKQIIAHMDWIQTHPADAKILAQRSQEIFRERFTLEDQTSLLSAFVESVQSSMAHKDEPEHGLVEVIVRVGSRPAKLVRRAIQSIADQTYSRISLIVVSFREVPGLDEMLAEFDGRFEQVRSFSAPDNGQRSTTFWAGLNAARGEFLCNLDDDDVIHPTHFASLVNCLVHHSPKPILVYAGAIKVQEEDGHWFEPANFSGDLNQFFEESRALLFLEAFSRERMERFDNFILSHAWMIRTSSLTKKILIDPQMKVGEDVVFYMMLMEHGLFVPSWRATVDWNWRSASKNNSMFASEQWAENPEIFVRLTASGVLPKPKRDYTAQIKEIIRKPSILLGPFAPRWRNYKAKLRAQRKARPKR